MLGEIRNLLLKVLYHLLVSHSRSSSILSVVLSLGSDLGLLLRHTRVHSELSFDGRKVDTTLLLITIVHVFILVTLDGGLALLGCTLLQLLLPFGALVGAVGRRSIRDGLKLSFLVGLLLFLLAQSLLLLCLLVFPTERREGILRRLFGTLVGRLVWLRNVGQRTNYTIRVVLVVV